MSDFAGTYLGLFIYWVVPWVFLFMRIAFSAIALSCFLHKNYQRGILAILIAGYILALEVT